MTDPRSTPSIPVAPATSRPKGHTTGNGPADRLIEKLRHEDQGMQRLSSGRFHLGAIVTDVETVIPNILKAERARMIASFRGRMGRMPRLDATPEAVAIADVKRLIDALEHDVIGESR